MEKHINLVKLSVGTESVETLQAWQEQYRQTLPEGLPRHVTRMWPFRVPHGNRMAPNLAPEVIQVKRNNPTHMMYEASYTCMVYMKLMNIYKYDAHNRLNAMWILRTGHT